MSEEEKKQPELPEAEDKFGRMLKDVRKGLKEFGSAALEKAEEIGKIASDKAEELTKTGKIRLDVMQLKRNQNKVYVELGTEVFDLHSSKKLKDLEKSDIFKNAVEKIKALDAEIAEKEEEIERIQDEEENESSEVEKS